MSKRVPRGTPSQEPVWAGRVPRELAGERLDQILAALVPQVSRAQAKRLISAGQCAVDGHAAKPSSRPEKGAAISLSLLEPQSKVAPESTPLCIIYEDAHLLAVNKPAGMVAHPARGTPQGTLLNALVGHVGAKARPTLVHRLDKDTSGAILAAKDTATHRQLCRQMTSGKLRRVYWAIVWGMPPSSGAIEAPMGRDRGDKTRMCVDASGKRAVTHYRVLTSAALTFGDVSLVEVRLETGRTHQIRVHFEHLGFPLLGDRVYGGARRELTRAEQALHGQALHSRSLVFTHPGSRARLAVEAEPPEAFSGLLARLQ